MPEQEEKHPENRESQNPETGRAARPFETVPDAAKRARPAEAGHRPASAPTTRVDPAFARPENEDDDGYDPWSDRRPTPEPLFERDPWD